MLGYIRVDGKALRWMGSGTATGKVTQTFQQVAPTNTYYMFEAGSVALNVTFSTPALVDDWEVWAANPVTFITADVASLDGQQHNVELFFTYTAEAVVEDVNMDVTWRRDPVSVPGHTVFTFGTTSQSVFGSQGDAMRPSWGYMYGVFPNSTSGFASSVGNSRNVTTAAFLAGMRFPADAVPPRKCSDDWPVVGVRWDLGAVGSQPASVRWLLSYDIGQSIEYFKKPLIPFWAKGTKRRMMWQCELARCRESRVGSGQPVYVSADKSVGDMLSASTASGDQLIASTRAFDSQLVSDLTAVGGAEYATLCSLVYRQCTGGMVHTVPPSTSGPLHSWSFVEEMSSDGDVSTVDVIYPLSPFLLHFNPQLLWRVIVPVLEYANNKTDIPYNLSWAPHHLGTWPVCDLPPNLQEQMPMEESGTCGWACIDCHFWQFSC